MLTSLLVLGTFFGTAANGCEQAQPIGSTVPVSSLGASAKVAAKAKEWFYRFQSGNIDRLKLTAQVNAELTGAMIRKEAARLSILGPPLSFSFIRSYPIEGMRGYDFLVQFRSARVIEMIAFDPRGLVAGTDFEIEVPDKGVV